MGGGFVVDSVAEWTRDGRGDVIVVPRGMATLPAAHSICAVVNHLFYAGKTGGFTVDHPGATLDEVDSIRRVALELMRLHRKLDRESGGVEGKW